MSIKGIKSERKKERGSERAKERESAIERAKLGAPPTGSRTDLRMFKLI